ncbi:thiamine-phosphate kinase [Candidatus Woesearchaeota archaeon]|nr:thiamine-phosphate kinase [Candidatus Woesearchaeota archaeon]
MKIKDIGGEFGLIVRIKSKIKLYSKDVVAGIGNDAAVLNYDKNNYILFTTDMLVENVHFSLKYYSPQQIGMKAVEQNVSDIAAMGGIPKFAIVSLALPNDIDVEFVDKLYNGINEKSKKYKISIVGGNITHSKEIVVSIAMIGFAEKKNLTLRKGAKINDLIFCSGDVGKSSTGLELLKHNIAGNSIKKHLEPKSRLDLARKIVKVGINSMIDVSDGIASEIKHICSESKVGARIYADKIPLSKNTIIDAKKLHKNPLDFALYGGEDFELVFTAPINKLKQLKKHDIVVIGEIVNKKYGTKLVKNNRKLELKIGFVHFK